MKCFFIFCFAVFFFAGCSKSSDQAQNMGLQSGVVETKKAKPTQTSKETIDLSKLAPQQRQVVESVAKDVAVLQTLFKDADNVFSQLWAKIWNDQLNKPDNVFRLVRKSLRSKYADNGLPLLAAQHGCQAHDYRLKQEAFGKYKLIYTNCTNRKNPSVEEYATIEKSIVAGKERWRVDFVASNLRRYLGNSLSLLGVSARCTTMQATENGHLQMLECSDLGQNWNSDLYLHITNIKFDRSAKQPLLVSGTVFDGLQKPKYVFQAKDLPYDNTLVIQGEESPREEEPVKVATVSEQPALSAPPVNPPPQVGGPSAAAPGVMPAPEANPVDGMPSHEMVGTDALAKKSTKPAQPGVAAKPGAPAARNGAAVPGATKLNGAWPGQNEQMPNEEFDEYGNPMESPETNPAEQQSVPSQAVT